MVGMNLNYSSGYLTERTRAPENRMRTLADMAQLSSQTLNLAPKLCRNVREPSKNSQHDPRGARYSHGIAAATLRVNDAEGNAPVPSACGAYAAIDSDGY